MSTRTRVRLTGLGCLLAWPVVFLVTAGGAVPWQIVVGLGITCDVAIIYLAYRGRHGIDHRQTWKMLRVMNGVWLGDSPTGGPAHTPIASDIDVLDAIEDERPR
jgi:hypothetical protein